MYLWHEIHNQFGLMIHLNAKQKVDMYGLSDSFEWKAGNLNRNE